MKDFNAIPSAIGLVLLIVGGVLHYNGALVVKSSPSRKLLVAKVIVQPPSQKEQQQRRRSPWNLDSWCQEHSSSSGEGCDKPEEALSIAVDSSESMTTILESIMTKIRMNPSAQCVCIEGDAAFNRLAPYFVHQGEQKSGRVLRGKSLGKHDDNETKSFLLKLWQSQSDVQTALCETLPKNDFVTWNLVGHDSTNRIPSEILNDDKNQDVLVLLEDDNDCEHQRVVHRERNWVFPCAKAEDELGEVVKFLTEIYASSMGRQVVAEAA